MRTSRVLSNRGSCPTSCEAPIAEHFRGFRSPTMASHEGFHKRHYPLSRDYAQLALTPLGDNHRRTSIASTKEITHPTLSFRAFPYFLLRINPCLCKESVTSVGLQPGYCCRLHEAALYALLPRRFQERKLSHVAVHLKDAVTLATSTVRLDPSRSIPCC